MLLPGVTLLTLDLLHARLKLIVRRHVLLAASATRILPNHQQGPSCPAGPRLCRIVRRARARRRARGGAVRI